MKVPSPEEVWHGAFDQQFGSSPGAGPTSWLSQYYKENVDNWPATNRIWSGHAGTFKR